MEETKKQYKEGVSARARFNVENKLCFDEYFLFQAGDIISGVIPT